ncbi:hypothetical protein [Paenibacillus sp. FSL K6-2862]|uniref:hypothetical protein n=1 Tax=Paenibacillus sp. FSL K6-2862 TaxID=2921484 RepID=UPI0030F4B903
MNNCRKLIFLGLSVALVSALFLPFSNISHAASSSDGEYWYKGESYANLLHWDNSNVNSNDTSLSTAVVTAKANYNPKIDRGKESITAWSRLDTINRLYPSPLYYPAQVNEIEVKFRVMDLSTDFDIYSTVPKHNITEYTVNPYLSGGVGMMFTILNYAIPGSDIIAAPFDMVMNNIKVQKGTDTSGGTGTIQSVKFKLPDSNKSSLPNSISYKEADYKTKGVGKEKGVTASFSYDMFSSSKKVIVTPQTKIKYSIHPIPFGGSYFPTIYASSNTAYFNHTIN